MPSAFADNVAPPSPQQGSWGGVTAEIIEIAGGRTLVPAMGDFRLGLHLGSAVTADCRCDGQHLRHVQAEGDMLFVPPGLSGSWQDDAACRLLRIRLDPSLMLAAARDLELDAMAVQLQPRLHFRDPALEQVGRALLALLQEPATGQVSIKMQAGVGLGQSAADARYAGLLGSALALRLLQSSGIRLPRQSIGGLSHQQQRRLIDYIEAHLDQSLPLTKLARFLELSVSHLTAQFRRTHGMSLHQFILERRLARACLLLQNSAMPISEVALATGFAHQSHLASVLRRHLATTPRQLRHGN
jgi:AraC family transcriptional regulator